MNTVTRTASAVKTTANLTNEIAYQWGARDAAAGAPRNPVTIFLQKSEQDKYMAGVASVEEKKATTRIIKRTENATFQNIVGAAALRQNRLEAMLAKTAAESPWAAGDILWAV